MLKLAFFSHRLSLYYIISMAPLGEYGSTISFRVHAPKVLVPANIPCLVLIRRVILYLGSIRANLVGSAIKWHLCLCELYLNGSWAKLSPHHPLIWRCQPTKHVFLYFRLPITLVVARFVVYFQIQKYFCSNIPPSFPLPHSFLRCSSLLGNIDHNPIRFFCV
jgi:hypothetical protein